MQKERKSGIYCIENMINHKKYIGQSININRRWKNHIRNLNNGCHNNVYLQNAWNKYGSDNFYFYILEQCNQEDLDAREIFYIDLFNTDDRNSGYNLKSGGQNGGSKYSEESRKKMSETHKELYKDEKNIEILKQNGLKVWANEEYRKSRSGENHPLYGKHLSEDIRKKISDSNKGKAKPPRTKKHCDAISNAKLGKDPPNKNNTPVKCIELNQIFKDAITAGKELNIKCPNHVIDVCNGRRKTCGGYHFEFINIGK